MTDSEMQLSAAAHGYCRDTVFGSRANGSQAQ
jgi:hypothetical protein